MNDLYNPCGLLLEWLTFADKDARNRFVLFTTDFAVERSLAPKHVIVAFLSQTFFLEKLELLHIH